LTSRIGGPQKARKFSMPDRWKLGRFHYSFDVITTALIKQVVEGVAKKGRIV
jgi:hypothetical protein